MNDAEAFRGIDARRSRDRLAEARERARKAESKTAEVQSQLRGAKLEIEYLRTVIEMFQVFRLPEDVRTGLSFVQIRNIETAIRAHATAGLLRHPLPGEDA